MKNFYVYLIAIASFAAAVLTVELIRYFYRIYVIKNSLNSSIKKTRSFNSQLSGDITRITASNWGKTLKWLGTLSLPSEEGWQDSAIRLKFIRAGYRDFRVIFFFYGLKTILFLLLPLIVGLSLSLFSSDIDFTTLMAIVFLIALIGYVIPDFFLKMRTSERSNEMQRTLPDLLDLMVICAESGMGIDAGLSRVSKEIVRSSPILSEELHLAMLEIRAGASRTNALKNLGMRVNLENMYNIVSILSQVDRFGSSLSDSLRIQADVMRTSMIQKAEELAAKIPVKMLFPLIFFMFPSIFIVIIGPALIQLKGVFD